MGFPPLLYSVSVTRVKALASILEKSGGIDVDPKGKLFLNFCIEKSCQYVVITEASGFCHSVATDNTKNYL